MATLTTTNHLKWIFLISLGLLTGLLLALPFLVIVGLLFLIIPGLILYIIPTLFVYLLPTFIIRLILPLRSEVAAHLVAFSLTVGLSAAIMNGFRTKEQRLYDQAALPEIVPVQKAILSGDIFVNWPKESYSRETEVACDFLCAGLLDTPGVTSVTTTNGIGQATFRLGPGNPGSLVAPVEPEQLLLKFERLDEELGIVQGKRRAHNDRSLQAVWGLRFASGEELRRDKPLGVEEAEWTIDFVQQYKKGLPSIDRVEIRDKDGTVIMRRSLVRHVVPAPLFYFGFDFDFFPQVHSRFTLGSSQVSNQPKYYSLAKEVELLRFTNIARPTIPQDVGDRIEKMVSEVLDNPNMKESQLLVVHKWLESLPFDSKGKYTAIFARILLDDRIADPMHLLSRIISSDTDLTPLRAGLAKRYLNAVDTESKTWYIDKLVHLPDGSFKSPSEDERAIFREGVLLVGCASNFLERIADQGPKVIPELLSLMEASQDRAPAIRSRLWEGIRNAFKRLGPNAAPAAPNLLSMIQERPSDFFYGTDNRIEWLVTLRLMGVDEEQLHRILDRQSTRNVDLIMKVVNKEVQMQLQDNKTPK
jgi:hypothetical protein